MKRLTLIIAATVIASVSLKAQYQPQQQQIPKDNVVAVDSVVIAGIAVNKIVIQSLTISIDSTARVSGALGYSGRAYMGNSGQINFSDVVALPSDIMLSEIKGYVIKVVANRHGVKLKL